jgi:aminodeoxyfutalosine deaminase
MSLPPRVDRHTHLEGSLDPGRVRLEAARVGRAVPASLEAYWRKELLPFDPHFLEAFFFACGFLTSREAVRDALRACVARLPGPSPEGPRGIDLWVSPHFLVRMAGFLTLEELWRGLDEGIAEARAAEVRVAVIIDAVNHFGVAHGHEVLDLVLGDLPSWVVGFSTGGLERVPFRDWAPVFDRARAAGLKLAAHAGENGPGSNVRDAVLEAGVSRIVHGVRAAEDPDLLAFLAQRRIPVDVCISSNRALLPDLGPHPLPRMLEAGVRCALGTDDPGVMPCDLPGEWAAAEGLGLGTAQLQSLRDHAAADAWCLAMP